MVELEGSSCSGTDQRGLVWMVLPQHGSLSVPGVSLPHAIPPPWEGLEGLLSRPCRLGMKVVEEGAGREPRLSSERPFPSAQGGGGRGASAKANCPDNGCYY